MVSADYIQQGLVQRGLPAHIAQGFVMNMRDESGLNPGINERAPLVQGSRGGYGLYQLTGPRRRAYESYASSRGVAFDNADAQLDFLMSELQGPEKRAAQSIFSTDNPQDAAVAIARDFLRPAASNLQKRVARYTGTKDPQAIASTQGTASMMQQEEEETPRGLLGGLGIQKMQEGAPGETGQRFYERDSFKDTAALLAQGFGRMGIMGMEEIADGIAKQRTEAKAKNKTVEYLRKSGRSDLADMVEQNLIGGKDAAAALLKQPDEKGQVVSAAQLREMYPGSEIADGLYNLKKDGTINKVGGGPQVVVNSGDKGANKFAELDAKTLVDVAATGMQAQRSIGQINRLETLLEGVPTGALGALKVAAGNFGIPTEGLDDLQAAQALINSLVPQQRPAGSGPMSDADLELFKQSLPRIINSPNGNQIILETMRGIAAYDAAGAEIVQRYRNGEITQAQAFANLAARPDPFAGVDLGASAQQGGGMSAEDAAKVLEGL